MSEQPTAAPMRPTEIARRYLISAAHKYARASDLLTSAATLNATELTLDERANLILLARNAATTANDIKRVADSVDAPPLALAPDLPSEAPTDDA